MVARKLAPQFMDERRLLGLERRQREPQDQAGDIVGAVARDREQEQGQRCPRLFVESAEQAEVEERQAPVRRQEHVSPMGIGVVNAFDGHLPDVGAEERSRETLRLFAGEPVLRRHLLAVDPLEDEHRLGDVGLGDLRHQELGKVGDGTPDELRVVGFLRQIELGAQMHLELVGEGLELEELRGLRTLVQEADGRPQHVEVELDLLQHTGATHLDDNLAPILQQRRVHLGDRRAGERLGVDACEGVLAELLVDSLPNLLERHRRGRVDELRELVDVDVRKEIWPRGQQLAELDVSRPQLLETLAKLLRSVACRRPAAGNADLVQDARQLAPPRDTRNLDGAS